MSSKQTSPNIPVWPDIPGKTIVLLAENRLLIKNQDNLNGKILDRLRNREIH